MRKLLPAVAVAAGIGLFASQALAARNSDERPRRAVSHVALHLSRHVVLHRRSVLVHGRVRPAGRRRVKLVFRGPHGGQRRVATRPSGTFRFRWRTDRTGSYAVRAYGVHSRRAAAAVSPARSLTVYRLAAASYYGPGLYGGGVACGGTLEPHTLGVASRTLPCGSRVKLRYRGRTVTVPVIDRGPYVAGRDFDLTAATRARLRFPAVGVLMATR
jgi:hypothetical protein